MPLRPARRLREHVDLLAHDLEYALRRLRRNPGFAIVTAGYIAIAIAANTAMFSVFNALALRALPFDHPEQLVSLGERDRATGRRASLSYLDYLDWQAQAHDLSMLAAHAGRMLAITEGEPERIAGRLVSASFFPLLGVSPQLGRAFTADDDAARASRIVVISDALWRRRFGGQRSVLGRSLSLNGEPHTIVGVMPPGFQYPGRSELWIPIGPLLHGTSRTTRGVSVLGRLRPGVEIPQALADLDAVARRLHAQYPAPGPATRDWRADVRSLRGSAVGSDERLVAAAMLGASVILLLIACSNVANLLLTRAIARQREIAVRAALGASRWRIARGLVFEALLIAGTGCVVAMPIAWESLRLIEAAIPESDAFPYYVHWSLDLPTFAYAVLVSLVAGALLGFAPAIFASSGRLHDALKVGTPGAGSAPRQRRMRNALVIVQVGLALVLLVGASLFVRTFVGLARTALGYDPSRIMTMRFDLPGARYDSTGARLRRVSDILRRVEALPGVTAATVSDLIPLDDTGGSEGDVETDVGSEASARMPSVVYGGVTGDWFATMGVSPVQGRTLSDRAPGNALPLAVINHNMAARFWPGTSAIGRRFRFERDSSRTWYTVIGVVPDIRTVKLDESRPTPPTAYVPFELVETRDYGLMVRTNGRPASIVPAVREAIHLADPTIPLFNVWTMDEVKYLSFWMFAMWGTMFGVFGGIALALAAVGVYAVIFFNVTQRTREIGVRVALGARRTDIVRLVLQQGLVLTGIGVACGLFGAFALTRVVGTLLIGISPTDPSSFVGVAIGLAAIAALAAWVPARRATRVDPLVALRAE